MYEERICIREGGQFPLAAVVVCKEAAKYHAWQPEYNIALTARSMDSALDQIAKQIGELLADPEYDYLDVESGGDRVYYAPLTLSPEEILQNPKELREMMLGYFPSSVSIGVEQYYIACVRPKLKIHKEK